MKKLTITMEESVADWVRLEAARRHTSMSRLVGEMLAEKMPQDDFYAQAMREALRFETLPFSGAYAKWEDLYAARLDRFC